MAQIAPLKIDLTAGVVAQMGSSDTVKVGNLGTGTPDATTLLRGDGAWVSPSTARTTLGLGALALVAGLTGPITSNGAGLTAVAAQTGTGSTFVMSAAPTITGRSTFVAASEPYAIGAKYVSSGGIVYFGATDGTATPGFQISNAGGGNLLSGATGGAISIPGTLDVTGLIRAGNDLYVNRANTSAYARTIYETGGTDHWATGLIAAGATNNYTIRNEQTGAITYFLDTGAVGLGASPTQKLDVTGTSTVYARVASSTTGSVNEGGLILTRGDQANGYAQVSYTTGATTVWQMGLRAGDAHYHFQSVASGDIAVLSTTGLGIGATPSRKLHVASASAMKLSTAMGALFNDVANDGGVIIGSDFAIGSIQGTNAAGTSANDLMFQKEGGRVGIGMTPARALDVTGTFGATGDATFGANLLGNNGSSTTIYTASTPVYLRAGTGAQLYLGAGGTNGLLNLTSDGRLYGTALHNNGGAVTGTTNQYIASGTYTPGVTGGSNMSSQTAFVCQWIRVGNVVTVSGEFEATFVAGGGAVTSLLVPLPIASNFSATTQLSGVGSSWESGVACEPWRIRANVAGDYADFTTSAYSTTANIRHTFVFQYQVL